jgi:hypothetical protein
LEPPLQVTSVSDVIVAMMPVGSVSSTLVTAVQPFASVTVTKYVPAVRPEAVAPVWAGDVLQLYVYGAVPPLAVTVAAPLMPPSQLGFVLAVIDAVTALAGSVTVAVAVLMQPLKSVTVTV